MRRGKRIANASMQLIFSPNQVGRSRFAFVVSTNVDKRATVRNRLKRLMREAVRALLPKLQENADVILQARSNREGEIRESVEELLRRANLL
jgi:ribonuclease P protein component